MTDTLVRTTASAKRSSGRPVASSKKLETCNDRRGKTGEEISASSLINVPSVWTYNAAAPQAAQPFNLRDIKRNTAEYTRRDIVCACLITGLSIALVETVVWLGSMLARV